MAFLFITKQSVDPLICDSSNDEAAPGDQVRLSLDADVVEGLPLFIYGVIQTPIARERMLNPETGCVVIGYEYLIGYESDDLDGALELLTADIITAMGCFTCCQVLEEALTAETAARVAADLVLTNGLAAETAARIAADTALFQSASFANAAGDTVITVPAGCRNYTVYGAFTGAAGTRNIALDLTNAVAGCRVTLVAALPATAAIVINLRNATVGGTILDTLTTDTSGDGASFESGFTTVWNKIQSLYPN